MLDLDRHAGMILRRIEPRVELGIEHALIDLGVDVLRVTHACPRWGYDGRMLKTVCVAALVLTAACDERPSGGHASGSAKPAVTSPVVVTPPPTAQPAEVPVAEAPIVEVTAKQLYADYDVNEVSADDKYKGKTLRVTGVIETIAKDVLGEPYVEFTTRYGLGVQCMFEDSDKPALAALKKGQKLVALSTGDGKSGNVILRRCVIEHVYEWKPK